MKNITLFRTKKEYEDFVFEKIISDTTLNTHPFYRNLVQFVLDSKAPLFYWQTDPSEHANFSAYYHFVLARDTYKDETIRSMYFLHDFTHMLFYYPHDVKSVTEEEFENAVLLSEYAASNETEIFIHYRVPGLRDKVFVD